MTVTASSLNPRVYFADLAAYNAGKLHGVWVDVDDLDTMKEGIQTMLAASPEPHAEEYEIHDYEGFGCIKLTAFESLEYVLVLAEFIREHGELGAAVLDYYSEEIDDAKKALEENYAGCFESLEEFAEHFLEETGDLSSIPKHLLPYIDYAALGRDLDLNGDVFTIETSYREVHVFWSR